MKRPDVVTWVLVACAVLTTTLVVRREIASSGAVGASDPSFRLPRWTDLTERGHAMGAADAPVKLVEFSDFQCPFCASLKPALARILEKYPAEVAIVYRHFPLQRIHPHAFEAARASECASAQGRFRQYHDALYARQVAIGVMSWGDFAEAAGVPDLRGFRSCMADTAHAGAVRTDLATATELGLRGTPTIILDGYVLTGPGLADLERRVDRAVRATRRD